MKTYQVCLDVRFVAGVLVLGISLIGTLGLAMVRQEQLQQYETQQVEAHWIREISRERGGLFGKIHPGLNQTTINMPDGPQVFEICIIPSTPTSPAAPH